MNSDVKVVVNLLAALIGLASRMGVDFRSVSQQIADSGPDGLSDADLYKIVQDAHGTDAAFDEAFKKKEGL